MLWPVTYSPSSFHTLINNNVSFISPINMGSHIAFSRYKLSFVNQNRQYLLA